MNNQNSSSVDILSELKKIQNNYESLKVQYETIESEKEQENQILEKLVNSSEELFKLIDEKPDYDKILQQIIDISGAKYATLNIFNENGRDFTTVAFLGLTKNYRKAMTFLGFEVVGKHWEYDPILAEKLNHSTITKFENLHDLSGIVLSETIVSHLQKAFNIGDTFAVKLANKDNVFGDFTLLFNKGKSLKNYKLVELYANQIGFFLERNKSIKALRESEAKHSSMISNISDVIAIIDPAGMVKYMSSNIEKWFGWKSEEIIGRIAWELVQHEDMGMIHKDFNGLLLNENHIEIAKLFFSCKDGSHKPIKLSGINLLNNPLIKGVLVNFRDISDTKEAEKAMLEAEWKFRALFEKGPIGVAYHKMIYDDSGKPADYLFLDVNESYKELTGVDPRGKTVKEAFPGIENDPSDWIGTFGKVAMTGKAIRFEQYLQSNNRWYDCVGYQYKQDYFVAAFLEITKRKKAEKEAEQIRENFETFFNSIDDFLFVLDTEGNIIHTNKTVNERLGYSAEELAGKSVLTVHPTERREEAARIVGEMLSGKVDLCPVPVITKAGIQIPVETRVTRGYWNGNPVIFGVTKDISKVKLSEEKFSKLFYINPSACGLTDLSNDQYLEVNEEFYRLLGYSKNEVLGKTAMELGILSSQSREQVLSKANENGGINNVETEIITKTGEIRNVLLSAENINIQDKRMRFTVVHDITEQKKNEEALRQSNHKWEAIIEASPDGIGILSLAGKVELVSEKLAEMYGYSKKEKDKLIGIAFLDFVHSSMHEAISYNFQKMIKGEKTDKISELLAVKRDKSLFYVEVNSTVLRDKNGKAVNILFIERDITDRKKAQKELLIAKEKAEESERLKSAFLANMSHEIRTPMNGILGFTELLKTPNLTDDKQQKYISIIEKSGDRMLNIINDIISISKVEAGQTELKIIETNINDQLEYIFTFFKPECIQKNITLSFSCSLAHTDAILKTDKEKVYAILTNLVKNAIKFTSDGSITFGYEKKEDWLEFFVKDSGTGIPQEHKILIFERFRQGSESVNRNYEGAGLGLSISKAYVEMLGGKIWVESEANRGAEFYFTLPMHFEAD